MRFRRNPLPRRLEEILCFLSIGVLLPIAFIHYILVVLPAVHELGSFPYVFALLTATFLMVNIEGNLLACMIIDTSVDQDRVEAASNGDKDCVGWKYCPQCHRLAPPRSWHCKLCGICILRRDHHCMFSGYCVGHRNHRYFICFLIYLMGASVQYLIYCSIYIWLENGTQFLFVNLLRNVMDSVFVIFYILNLVLIILAFVALNYYVPMLLRGEVFGESNHNIHEFNNGVDNNLRTVFGQRMYVAWIFPSIASQLPEDGYTWQKRK